MRSTKKINFYSDNKINKSASKRRPAPPWDSAILTTQTYCKFEQNCFFGDGTPRAAADDDSEKSAQRLIFTDSTSTGCIKKPLDTKLSILYKMKLNTKKNLQVKEEAF